MHSRSNPATRINTIKILSEYVHIQLKNKEKNANEFTCDVIIKREILQKNILNFDSQKSSSSHN